MLTAQNQIGVYQFNSTFKDAIVTNQKQVVFDHDILWNLFSFEKFGKELAFNSKNARDTWLIEITGGPEQDCDTCPNYRYEDMIDYYWPALVAGVEYYSGQNKIDYIGHSNGCRSALDSLKNWSATGKKNAGYCFNTVTGKYDVVCNLSAIPVDAFVGIACPGAFDGYSSYAYYFNKSADELKNNLVVNKHVTGGELSKSLLNSKNCKISFNCILTAGSLLLIGDNAISYSLGDKYLYFIQNNSDSQLGINLNINRLLVYNGIINRATSILYDRPINTEHDLMVSTQDGDAIYNNIQANKKYHFESYGIHAGTSALAIYGRDITKRVIREFLNNQTFSSSDKKYLVEED
mgnify:CR=1 FL=1